MSVTPDVEHRSVVKRAWLAFTALILIGGAFAALMMFGWMMDETHFDRPDKGFDRLTAQIERTSGVSIHAKERWVEAPTFSDPSSWIQLTVDETHLPGLLATACVSHYSDAVAWSVRVPTANGSVVSLYSSTTPGDRDDDARCPDFGFDAVGLVKEVGRSVPGLDLQATIWDNGRFALVVLEDDPGTMSALLPLVDRAGDVRDAAGLDPRQSVEINASTLSLVIRPDEHDRYLALLSDLAEHHGVTSYWADGGTPIDDIEKVQITAPEREHAAIEDAIRTSGLNIAESSVRFIPLTP